MHEAQAASLSCSRGPPRPRGAEHACMPSDTMIQTCDSFSARAVFREGTGASSFSPVPPSLRPFVPPSLRPSVPPSLRPFVPPSLGSRAQPAPCIHLRESASRLTASSGRSLQSRYRWEADDEHGRKDDCASKTGASTASPGRRDAVPMVLVLFIGDLSVWYVVQRFRCVSPRNLQARDRRHRGFSPPREARPVGGGNRLALSEVGSPQRTEVPLHLALS